MNPSLLSLPAALNTWKGPLPPKRLLVTRSTIGARGLSRCLYHMVQNAHSAQPSTGSARSYPPFLLHDCVPISSSCRAGHWLSGMRQAPCCNQRCMCSIESRVPTSMKASGVRLSRLLPSLHEIDLSPHSLLGPSADEPAWHPAICWDCMRCLLNALRCCRCV